MENVIIFETAKALKESGYLEPSPEMGQFWYSPKGELWMVNSRKYEEPKMKRVERIYYTTQILVAKSDDWVYAPGAVDIISALNKEKKAYTLMFKAGLFLAKIHNRSQIYTNTNAAECAAQLWINSKKQN
jgi:esterase/lipase